MSDTNDHPSGILQEMTIEDVEALDPEIVVFGIASTEPHGPHLPYGTDTFQTDGLCESAVKQANERGARVLLYPTLPIGNNVNFRRFPFACRMRVRTLMNVVLDVIEALEAEGVQKILLVNGHGGNTATLKATLREHAGRGDPDDGAFVAMVKSTDAIPDETAARIEHPSGHAGESEVSRMLYLRPDLVDETAFEDFPIQTATVPELDDDGVYFVPPWDGYMPRSAGGVTSASSAEKGEAFIEDAADWIADLLVALDAADVHEHFPYPDDS
ncbi:creatininase family protein [Haloarchaeobius sp. TZWSO28]|uniref:creatininase family protein n=1 Tax=Haloarchaeobius sp. TZWSO28 TaxID=3446119 RepID=UPI003EBA0DD3